MKQHLLKHRTVLDCGRRLPLRNLPMREKRQRPAALQDAAAPARAPSDSLPGYMSVNTRRISMLTVLAVFLSLIVRAETIFIVVPSPATPRVEFGASRLVEALRGVKQDARIVQSENGSGRKIHLEAPHDPAAGHEGFRIHSTGHD